MGIFDGIVGSLISGIGGVVTNNQQSTFNAEQAQLNRDFQEQMSSTAYQRGMADMKAAGLNPILAYQKGGASSPSGSTASATFVNPGSEAVRSFNETSRTSADTALTKQNELNAKATFDQIQANTAKTLAETTVADQQARVLAASVPRTEQETHKLLSENTARSIDSDYYKTTIGKYGRYFGNFLSEMNPLKGFIQLGR